MLFPTVSSAYILRTYALLSSRLVVSKSKVQWKPGFVISVAGLFPIA